MGNYHIRKTLRKGLNRIVPEGRMKYLSLDLLLLDKGREYEGTSLGNELGLPVKFVGIGEQPTDVEPFDPESFVEALFS